LMPEQRDSGYFFLPLPLIAAIFRLW